MTIKEYFSNYTTICKEHFLLPKGACSSIDGFFNACISPCLLDKDYVLKWHGMLMQYAGRDDSILWIRYYESGSKVNGRYNNRRSALTQFSDGFSYVFVSNFDVHEIWNMVRLHVEPDIDLFVEMMKNHTYPFHYGSGKSCEEYDIHAYPNIGTAKAGILTCSHRYLAHIYGVNSDFFSSDGQRIGVDVEHIFPRGKLSDWSRPTPNSIMARQLNYSLSQNEKNLVKAHFLRFVDPLNYYAVPGQSYEKNNIGKKIGEYSYLNYYMQQKYKTLYGVAAMTQFCEKAMIPSMDANETAIPFSIEYGKKIEKEKKTKKSVTKNSSSVPKKRLGTTANVVKKEIVPILESGKLPQSDIDALLTKEGSKSILGLSGFAALSTVRDQTNSTRYYKDPIHIHNQAYYLCSQWREKSEPILEQWINCHKHLIP